MHAENHHHADPAASVLQRTPRGLMVRYVLDHAASV